MKTKTTARFTIGALVAVFAAMPSSQASPAGLAAATDAGPQVHYTFESLSADGYVPNSAGSGFNGRLEGGATLEQNDGVDALYLNGSSAFLEVEGSEGLHIGPEGFSFVATVRFADSGREEGAPDAHDIILFKEGEYLLGRLANKLYFNLHDGEGWKSHVLAGPMPTGQWCHVALVVKRNFDPAQGVNGYTVQISLDGLLLKNVELPNREITETQNAVTVGKGFGGVWFFHGEIAELAIYPRAILEGELNALLAKEKLAEVKVRHVVVPDPRYPQLLAEIRAELAKRSPEERRSRERLLAAIEQAGTLVGSQTELLPFLQTVRAQSVSDRAGKTPDPLAEFAAAHPQFTFLDNERLGLTFFAPRPDSVTFCGIFDFATGQELLGDQRELWILSHEPSGGGALSESDSAAPIVKSSLSVDRAKNEAVLEWKQAADNDQPFAFTARSKLRLDGPRLSLNLDVQNESANVALREVQFPTIQLRRLADGVDRLLVPRQSGVLHENPVTNLFRYEAKYPSGNAHMQFFAYYDERQGVYVACEDPLGRTKDLLSTAIGEDNRLSFLWFVGCPAGTGGNNFATSGEAVVEAFAGDWFDAAQIYKKFARTAAWWPASRTRADTPEWYRNLSVWIQGKVNTDEELADLMTIQDYLELPVGVHAYDWSEADWPQFCGHPHFIPAKPGFKERVAQLQAHSIHVKPYINARLWDTRDRVAREASQLQWANGAFVPVTSDGDKENAGPEADPESSEYLNAAKPNAAKGRDQSVFTEEYTGRLYAIMCPATTLWQDTIKELSKAVAEYGVDGIYYDQVSAGAPKICFDPSHPHAAGSGEAWLEQGYWPMFAAIRKELKPQYPDLIFDSEDAAEPYMHLFDGYLPWRFVDVGRVPAYQSIYAGRIQMTGRVNTAPLKAKFAVAAEQMLYGEQIGWFGPPTVLDNNEFGLFVKKLAHARQAFLPFFNEGDMLKPAHWASPMPSMTEDWGYYGPRIITTPALMQSAWQLGKSIAVIFVNTTAESVTGELVPPGKAWGLPAQVTVTEFHEKLPPHTATWTTANAKRITVPGYSVAAWVIDGDSNPSLAESFSKIGHFQLRTPSQPEKSE